ncbi:hypothetical protein [Erwinia sp. HR93]|uniref:hypothetical protein n=1 Tax=Erwinia sp. HR93 TaxID=3094840 RepID=UPI002ADEA604|nr:hypothetical protein [Erwinia sp. HR93]MEA1064775.1 hypothetical protein [Erwinia sp. HR93]
MRSAPVYPEYKTARPPAAARWLSASALLVLSCGGVGALWPSTQGESSPVALGILVALMLAGTGWLVRLLYYRTSMHNAAFYYQLVAYEQQQWWAQHRQSFWLKEVLLLGPAGTRSVDWLRVLNREQRPPEEKKEGGSGALRLPQISAIDPSAREKWLAEMLVIEWQKQRSEIKLTSPLRCYWQGADITWQAFRAQMALTFPEIALPARPEPWQGEASLAEIASDLAEAKPEDTMLIAGCLVVAAQPGTALPAGESAVLWLAGRNGPVQLTRGETFSPAKGDILPTVFARALEQSEIKDPPEACMLFSQPDIKALASGGWDVSQHLQDANWGDIGDMDALIVLSLAAIYAEHHQQPCGWIARDPMNPLATGIIKPDGQRQ